MKQICKWILLLLKTKERNKLYKLIVFDVLISAFDIGFLGLFILIIGFFTSEKLIKSTYLLQYGWLNSRPILFTGLFLILFCIKNWLGYLISRFQHRFFYDVASRLSKRNLLNYFKSTYLQFVNVDSSVHIRQISQQPVEFSHYILNNVQQTISQSILVTFTICAILLYKPVLFLLLLFIMLPPVAGLAYFIRYRSNLVRVKTKVAGEKTLQFLQESLAGYVESNIYNKSGFLTDRYINFQQQLNNNLAAQQTLQGLPSRLIEVFALSGFFLLLLINKWPGHSQFVDLPTIGIFMAAAYKIIPGIIKILNSIGQIKTYQFTLNDLLTINDAELYNVNVSPLNIVSPISSVRFQNIGFCYKDNYILNDVSFEIFSGDFVGITAVSGKGKTTLINLLLGFLTPGAGNIYINGKLANNIKLQRYHKKITYIKQQTYFIHDTFRKNITLDDGEYDSEKLNEVIFFCGLEQLFASFEDGINMIINEGGKNFSGGQRQRIVLARALYHDFDLLILDEPFSEIDKQGEGLILLKLKQLAEQGKIIIFITHNTESLAYCNKFIALND